MDIIYPIAAMVALTLCVAFAVGISRLISVRTRQIKPSYFKVFTGAEPPEHILRIGRNYSNLLEMPVLFYLVCTLSLVLNISSAYLLNLAWGYFIFRVVHSLIHLSYNHPIHRFLVFLLSCLCLIAMWVELLLQVSAQQ